MPGIWDRFRRILGRTRNEPSAAPASAEPEPHTVSGESPVDDALAESPITGHRVQWEPDAEGAAPHIAATSEQGAGEGNLDRTAPRMGAIPPRDAEAEHLGRAAPRIAAIPDGAGESSAAMPAAGAPGTAAVDSPTKPDELGSAAVPGELTDDDVLHGDHLLLTCPYCGFLDQRVGSRCENCGQVIVRLPPWAQRRRQNWFMRRLSWRRIIAACAIVLFIVFVVWLNYPFAPDPTVLFKRTQSQLGIDTSPGSWSAIGRDLRHSRRVIFGPPPPSGNIVWQNTDIAEPLASEPVAFGSNIYVGSASGMYALSHHDLVSREGWEGDTPGRVNGAAAVVDAYLFFGSTDHTVNAWNALTGDARWSFATEDTVEVSPVVTGGLVYIGSGKGWIYALDAQNGALIWKRQLDSSASAAVAIYEGRLFVGDDKGIFYILSSRTGQEFFRYRTPRAIAGSPVISGDGERAYFASGGELYAVDAQQREIPGLYQFKQLWAQLWLWQVPGVPRPRGQQGGLWRFTTENPLLGVKSSPALVDDEAGGILYVGAHDHTMYVLNAADGSVRWTFEADDAIWASPLVVKNQLIFGDDAGYIYSLNRETGELSWKLDVGGKVRIAPVLSNGLLIVRTADGKVLGIE